ncbi:MAG: 4-alpha-glucanotransferase [Alkalispirochaeta sp.]
MKYPHTTNKVTGVLVPLAGLRTEQSIGNGEFPDLAVLGEWCVSVGIELIQLLPVNDTGGQSSPYSALSANALHPIYIRITDLPEYNALPESVRSGIDAELSEGATRFNAPARFDYPEVLAFRMKILRRIYETSRAVTESAEQITSFIHGNRWVTGYAVFMAIKKRHDGAAWTDWDEERDIDAAGLERLRQRSDLAGDTRFYTWLQLRAAEQFAAAAKTLDSLGVALKGDIPILMNEDSADAWYDRDIFRPDLRAGAPPDMFTELGQNWGFPIYNWQHLEERDFDWWRDRLRNAAQYYHAYRIDHVLGFFRIWAVPAGNYSGIPGFFWPQKGISLDTLRNAGFDEGRINWLLEPNIPGEVLRERAGDAVAHLEGPVLTRLEGEDLYLFSPAVAGEQNLADLDLGEAPGSDTLRDWLIEQYRDRALVPLPDGTYAPTWLFRECSRYRLLSDEEKGRFEALVAEAGVASNELWAEHGRRVLTVMKESTEMLPCAEDLGVVPEAVPRVLADLGILGLKIPRWTYYWDRPGQPIVPFEEYPELSVCAPSVHDTSTMRGWWEQEEGREDLWRNLGFDTAAPPMFDPAVARSVYRGLLNTPSRIVVFALQDLLVLSPEIVHDEPALERVNVPGTYNTFNWTWRMPLTIEELQQNPTLAAEITALTSIRRIDRRQQ